jgi:hypothetical protein
MATWKSRMDLILGKTAQIMCTSFQLTLLLRFGRWRGWIEKRYDLQNKYCDPFEIIGANYRAAERHLDTTPEEMARRQARGWGNEPVCRSIYKSGAQIEASSRIVLKSVPQHQRTLVCTYRRTSNHSLRSKTPKNPRHRHLHPSRVK